MRKPKNYIWAGSLSWTDMLNKNKQTDLIMDFITSEELQDKMESGTGFILLDVREPFEANISNLKHETTSIPYNKLGNEVENLEMDREYIVFCRSGATSKDACNMLKEAGFKNVKSLKGGINNWAKKIDPSLPQY